MYRIISRHGIRARSFHRGQVRSYRPCQKDRLATTARLSQAIRNRTNPQSSRGTRCGTRAMRSLYPDGPRKGPSWFLEQELTEKEDLQPSPTANFLKTRLLRRF